MRGPSQFSAETDAAGRFIRQESVFRGVVSPGPGAEYPAERGRYHLYVSYACPWAHRTMIARHLKGLDEVVSMSAVDPIRDERGWAFRRGRGHGPDPVNGFAYLSEAYSTTDPAWSGRVTVPVLWDRVSARIVSNESQDIVRILDHGFGDLASHTPVLRPNDLAPEIDRVNAIVYPCINNGVYRAGFAASQTAYDEAVADLAHGLAQVEEILTTSRWLAGNRFTEADLRLFTTLVRFDPVYHTHFKCNARLITDSPALVGFVRDVAGIPGVMQTIDMDHIKRHYYGTHAVLNPSGIVPVSDGPDLAAPHGREALGPDPLRG